MLDRSYDAERINVVVNDPEVRPFVGAIELGDVDLTSVVERPENWFLMGEHGGFGLVWSAPGVHEIHTFILPLGRGKWATKAAETMIAFARENGDTMLWTKIPSKFKNVSIYARLMGMKTTDIVVKTFGEPYEVYKMELN